MLRFQKGNHLESITAYSGGQWSPENEKKWIDDAKKRACPFVKRKCRADCMAFRRYEYPCCVLAQDSRRVRGHAGLVVLNENPQI